jgi:hypothetical protein
VTSSASAIIAAIRAGATLYQEGDRVWYLGRVDHPRESVDASVCDWLEMRGYVAENGDDESPGYSRGWKRWYILGKLLQTQPSPHNRHYKLSEETVITLQGDGTATLEVLYTDDVAAIRLTAIEVAHLRAVLNQEPQP